MSSSFNLTRAYGEHIQTLLAGYGAAIAAGNYDALIIASGRAASKNRFDDQHWALSPTPAFLHWLPLPEPDAFLVIRPGAKPTLIRTAVDDFWDSAPISDADHAWSSFDVVTVSEGKEAAHFPSGRIAVITRDPDHSPVAGADVNPTALVAAVDLVRTRKTEYELYCLQLATVRAVRGHRVTEQLFRQGDPSELALHLAYLAATEQDDSDAPYKGIVALGDHSAVLHYINYGKQPRGVTDTSLLVDAGARHWGYGSDITRTYARGTSAPAKRFADLIARMDRLQLEIVASIKVGTEYEALHDLSHQLIADVLIETGIAAKEASAQELLARGITRVFFPHGLGHSLGIVTHDVGMKPRAPRSDNRFLRNTSVIENGQVFTIEPGLYFIEALLTPVRSDDRKNLVDWNSVTELAQFGGIRIEDNVAVIPGGTRNLTRNAFFPGH